MKKVLYTLIGIGILLNACSDGAPSAEGPKPSINPPVINKFTVAKAGESGGGTSVTIDAGGSVELAWSVGGADKVELKSAGNKVAVHEVQAEGKETVTDIQADESFTLTAYNQGVSVQSTVRVSVPKQATLEILSFTAQPAAVEPGQSTTLCYEVNPVEAEIHIFDATGAEVPLATTEKPADETPVEESEEPKSIVEGVSLAIMAPSINLPPPGRAAETEVTAETPPTGGTTGPAIPPPGTPEPVMPTAATNKGCSVEVTPAATTSYVLVAKLADGTSKDATATVTVAEGLTIESFVAKDANGKPVTSLSAPGKVTLEWVVKPADAKVEIDQGVGDVTSATVDGKGSKEVEVKSTTTFTLTASKDGMASQSLSLSVAVEAPKLNPNLQLQANTQNIFAGEEVTLSTVVMDTMGGAPTESLVVRGPDGKEIQGQGATVKVKPMQSGAYQAVRLGDTVVTSNAVQVNVRTFEAKRDGAATAVGKSGTATYVGLEASLASGKLNLLKQESVDGAVTDIPLAFIEQFKKPGGWTYFADPAKGNDGEFKKFNPYTINAIVQSPTSDPEKPLLLVGMSGGLFMSADGGKTFGIVDAFRYITKGNGTHLSCKGRIQNGRDSGEEKFGGLQQVCDVLTLPSGKTVLAYDAGVITTANVAARAKDRDNPANFWKGLPTSDGKPGNALFGGVSHALAFDATNNVLYVASDKGVYQSSDDAVTFTEVGSLGEPAYSVAIASDGTVYAGTKDRLVRFSTDAWETVQSFELVTSETDTPSTPAPDTETTVAAPSTKADTATPAPAPAPKSPKKELKAICPDGSSCVVSIVEDPSVAGTLYVGTGSGLQVLRNGKLSVSVNTAFGGTTETPVAVRAISVSTASDIYVATSKGIFISRGESQTSPVETPKPSPESPQPSAVEARKVTVAAVAGHKFEPAVIEVNVGDKVEITFVNNDIDEHTMTTDGYPTLVNGLVAFDLLASAGSTTGAQVSFTATKAGEIPFFCKYHKDAGMTGKIVVKEVVPQ